RFFTATTLMQELQRAKADYTLAKALNKLDRYALLVVDDNRFAEAKVRADLAEQATRRVTALEARLAARARRLAARPIGSR
ncbi:MAG: hypothetical protein EBZ00_00985, partial [Actinobacteria bacterium]|nr:hypothetical protein [Actinomycetota bacterium]